MEVVGGGDDGLVGRDDDVLHPEPNLVVVENKLPLLLLAADLRDGEVGHEALRLANPVPSATEGADHQEWPCDPRCPEVAQRREGLDCFPQTHVVTQDSAATVVQHVNQPVHAGGLVAVECRPLTQQRRSRMFQEICVSRPIFDWLGGERRQHLANSLGFEAALLLHDDVLPGAGLREHDGLGAVRQTSDPDCAHAGAEVERRQGFAGCIGGDAAEGSSGGEGLHEVGPQRQERVAPLLRRLPELLAGPLRHVHLLLHLRWGQPRAHLTPEHIRAVDADWTPPLAAAHEALRVNEPVDAADVEGTGAAIAQKQPPRILTNLAEVVAHVAALRASLSGSVAHPLCHHHPPLDTDQRLASSSGWWQTINRNSCLGVDAVPAPQLPAPLGCKLLEHDGMDLLGCHRVTLCTDVEIATVLATKGRAHPRADVAIVHGSELAHQNVAAVAAMPRLHEGTRWRCGTSCAEVVIAPLRAPVCRSLQLAAVAPVLGPDALPQDMATRAASCLRLIPSG
mmetsp:Transcript_25290/g.84466  ORF Transcript_25290/g.84466 Transcript_25290/m.84466 type:complete len:510 (+) Transcript_25290:5209-6738(+)